MTRLCILAPLAALLLSNAPLARPSAPRAAPAQFVTTQHGLTFRSTPGSTYCPLAADWIGSDHGTILFLVPPRQCGGAGYPSISRGFAPATSPRIEVYYAYWTGEDEPPPPSCHSIGRVRLTGHDRPLCQGTRGSMVTIDATARYMADSETEVAISLVTTPARLGADLVKFRALIASVRTCVSVERAEDENGRPTGKPYTLGPARAARPPRATSDRFPSALLQLK